MKNLNLHNEPCEPAPAHFSCGAQKLHPPTPLIPQPEAGVLQPHAATYGEGWTRRKVIKAGLVSAGLAAMGNVSALDAFAQKAGTARYSLQIPPVVSPANLALTCAPSRVDFGDGRLSNVLAYNGSLPGPTLLARTGDTAKIALHNGLSERTITHWHGLVVDPENDGGPLYSINPGETYHYDYPIIQRAALNFYHPHPHHLTGKQVNLGLAGAYIIRDAEEDALGLPSGPYEVPLIIRDATIDKHGNLIYKPSSSGFFGKFPLVNGTCNAALPVDRGVYRFRVLNGSNARVFRIALSNGALFAVIGNDGGLLESPAAVSQIEFGPGERLDLLVDFSGLARGATVTLRCLDVRWDLLQFVGTGDPGMSYHLPDHLSTIEPLAGPSLPTRTFNFGGMSRINGLSYEHDRLDFRVPLDVTERWRFTTGGNAPHPVHVHGASFQVVSRTTGRRQVFPWERGWKDTVLLNKQDTVDVFVRFTAYRGWYVLHCHQLEHEDHGMMSNFEVY
jgi:blue copper oxidase